MRDDGSFVVKSAITSMVAAGEATGIAGEYLWPIHPVGLSNLYRASPEHGRAIQIKAETAFGNGLVGDGAERLDDLTETGAADLFVMIGLDMEAYGNAFLQLIMSADKTRLIGLRRLPAITMSRYRGGFMQRVVKPDGNTKTITFTQKEILHLRVPCPMGKRYALPTWIGVEGMLELAHSAIKFNASFFNNNAMPEYAIIFKGAKPSEAQKQAVKEFFRSEYLGLDNQHRTLVLSTSEDSEITVEKLTADMKEADFLKLLDAARDRMPVAHGVPTRMLGIMSGGQLGGGGEVEGQLFIFEALTLKPKRRWLLNQLRPVLKLLGLKPARPNVEKSEELQPDEVMFQGLDLTPPSDDVEDLPALVQSGIMTPEQAAELLPFLQNQKSKSKSAAGAPVSANPRSDDANTTDQLIALLARL